MRTPLLLLILIFPLFAFVPANLAVNPDISTPEKSFASVVEILKAGETEQLESIATPTGIKSLVVLAQQSDYENGMTSLGEELDASELAWAMITDEIYFLTATGDGKTHKMEFTKEEPGWMLYHLQLGGGVDTQHTPDSSEMPSDFSFDD